MVEELNAIESMPMAVDAAMQQGDLGAKVSVPPEPIRVHKPRASHARIVGDNLLVNEGHVRAFRNDRAPLQKTILVHHDSTANWLTHMLRELFAEVVMVHCPDFDLTFLRRFKPAVCLFIQIERFFVRPLSNDIDLASFVKGQEDRKSTNASMTSFLADMAA